MKKIIIKIMILLIAIIPIKTYAFGYTSFTSEDESVQVYIEGEDDEVYHYEEYTFEDVTETVKEDKELLTKIEEYGTLVKAFDTDFGIEETFEKYYTEFIINFDGKMDLPKKLALLVIDDDGNFVPGLQYNYIFEDDCKYYSFGNIYHDGRIIIIDPKVKTTYELQDDVAKLKFKDYKYKQYKENNMVFGRLSQVFGNDELVKGIAESKGLDVNEFLNKYGMDTTIAAMDEFSLEIDEELNRIIKNQNFLDSYGAFLVNPLFNTYDSISKIESSFDISVKIDDALKDYTDYSVYQLNSSVKVTSGVFEEGHDYYYYDPETKETEYIEISKYLTNAPILPSYHILETRGSMDYREVTTETFTAIANLIFGYYTYDGLNYNKIPSGSFNIGDKISSYGETVYIKDSYKLTEDTTFQEGKEYYIESSNGSYTSFTSGYPAYGSSIEEYISKTGYEIYCNKINMELLKEHAYAEDEYLNFSYDYDEKLSQTPVFIVLGTSKEDAKKTVSFDTNGGNNIISQEVIFGEFATAPTAPTKTGYTFEAWYEDEELKTEFDFETHITKDVTLYAKWEDKTYTYEFINGNNQELTIDDIKSFVLKVDGDYSLFESITIGKLDLIKNEDYTVTEGSTVITFTDKGIAKLNTLSKGDHEILVTYTNNKEVKGKLTIKQIVTPEPEIENPQTGDKYTTYLITGIISLISIIGISFYTREKLVR